MEPSPPARVQLLLAVTTGLVGAVALALLLHRQRDRHRLSVSKLVVYPIKGCKGIPVLSAKVFAEGLEHDREFMIVSPGKGSESGTWKPASQREIPSMALVEPSMPSAEGTMAVHAPGLQALIVTTPSPGSTRIPVEIFGDAAEGLDCGDDAAEWLSTCLKEPGLRLLRHVGVRRTDETFAKGVSRFSDGFPLLVTTEASLENVERTSGLGSAVKRFRPNLVFAGAAEFAEDMVRGVACGSGNGITRFSFVKPCARCQVPSVDPDVGARGPDPLRQMRPYRSGRALQSQDTAHSAHFGANLGLIFFGQNAVPDLDVGSEGTVSVGDPAEWMHALEG